jgi:hypothetical protein
MATASGLERTKQSRSGVGTQQLHVCFAQALGLDSTEGIKKKKKKGARGHVYFGKSASNWTLQFWFLSSDP